MNQRDQISSLGINPGQFRHHVTLLEPTITEDASGSVTTYAPATPPVKAWAKIEGIRAEDAVKSGETISAVQLTITVRYNAAFTPNKQIQRFNGNRYFIRGVENVLEMNAYLVLTCEGVGLNA